MKHSEAELRFNITDRGSYVLVVTPEQALQSLGVVLAHGINKHGEFRPQDFTPEHFIAKYRRHMLRSLEQPLSNNLAVCDEETSEPHLVHAAADLLLAWECEKYRRK